MIELINRLYVSCHVTQLLIEPCLNLLFLAQLLFMSCSGKSIQWNTYILTRLEHDTPIRIFAPPESLGLCLVL